MTVSLTKRTEVEAQLRGSGISYSLMYLGYIPVAQPVSKMSRCTRDSLAKAAVQLMLARKTGDPTIQPQLEEYGLDEPTVLDLRIILNINAKDITVIHDDKNSHKKQNLGKIIQRHPIRKIAFFEQFEQDRSDEDWFIYIAKKADGGNRRCHIYSADCELVKNIMDNLDEATLLCNTDALPNEKMRRLSFNTNNDNSSSGSITPRSLVQDLTTPLANPNQS